MKSKLVKSKKKVVKSKTRKQSIRGLQTKADRLLQIKFVAENLRCIVCGQPTSEGHHVVYKSRSNALRYDMKNLVSLCRSCHYKHHLGDPDIMTKFLNKKGFAWMEDLQRRRRVLVKMNREYLLEIIKGLEV